MKLYISKNFGVMRKILLLFAIMTAVFILASQGAYAMSLTAFTVSPDNDTKVKLDWSSVAGARIYQLIRQEGTSPDTTIATIDVNSVQDPLSFTDSGLMPATAYNYLVRAYSDTGAAIQLDGKSAMVTTDRMIKPYNIKAVFDINSKIASLTWNCSTRTTATVIYRTENGVTNTSPAINATSYLFETVTGSVPVQIALKSIGNAGLESNVSDLVTINPVNPPLIAANASGGNTTITWGDFPQIGQFQLERSSWSGTAWDNWVTINTALSGSNATDTPASGGQYRYRLSAKSSGNYSGYSNISETVRGLPAPTNLSLTVAGPGSINITWVNGAGNTAKIQVLRKQPDGTFLPVAQMPSTATFLLDMVNMSPGTTYTYRVRSYESDTSYSASIEASITAALPAPPSSLRVNVISSSGIMLNWTDNSTNESGFKIERMTDLGSVFTLIDTAASNTTTYTDNNASNGHTYIYRLRAYNALGDSAYSSEATVSAWDSVAPAMLTVTPVSATRLDLSWNYTGTESYNTIIERKTGTDGTWTVIYTTALGTLKYSDTGLTPNTRYFYRIRKSMGTGSSGLSYPNNEIGIGAYTNLGNLTLTGTPAVNNTIYLSWTGNSGTADVVIERKMANGSFSALETVSYAAAGWSDTTGLVPSASYTYRVKARTTTNESVYSNIITVKNLYLDAPSSLSVTVTTNSAVELNWHDNSTDETGFEIWRYIYGSGTYSLYATVDKNITTYTDNTIQRGVQYNYMVRAYVASGSLYSPYSNSASIGSGLINPPSKLTYEYVSSTQVLLKWTDTSDNENGFKVEQKVGSDGVWNILTWLDPNVTAYTVSNLNPYTKYYFRIRAYSNEGNSNSLSDEILISTAIPAAPSNVVATALSASQIKITWKDNSDSEDVFRILRMPANAYNFDVLAEVGKDNTAYTDSNLIAGMKYSYKVVAYNSTGSSTSSAVEARTNTKATFSDLKSVSWARDAIENLAGMGIMKGVTATLYKPDNTVTKADFTAMVVRAFRLNTAPVGNMADVKSNKWYYNEIMIAENLGIISGDADNKFYPEKAIIREEIAVILFKVKQISAKPLTIYNNSVLERFIDKNRISPDAMASMATVVGEGIMEGLPGNAIGPAVTATRAQAAVLLYRTMNK